MTKALTKAPATAAAPFGSLEAVDPKKLEQTIEQMYFQGKNVSPEQKTVFRHAVNRTGLDPIVGQIRAVFRHDNRTGKDAMAIQTSIDGYRLIADRTGLYAGSDDAVYSVGADSWDHPSKASVTVWKFVQGQRCPFTASAKWLEYFPQLASQQFMWKKMPYLMLAKCAEALALRKAFPADLSGIYTDDEMQQAGTKEEGKPEIIETAPAPEPTPVAPVTPPRMSTSDQQSAILRLADELKMNVQKDICTPARLVWPLTFGQAEAVITRLEQKKKELSKELDAKGEKPAEVVQEEEKAYADVERQALQKS